VTGPYRLKRWGEAVIAKSSNEQQMKVGFAVVLVDSALPEVRRYKRYKIKKEADASFFTVIRF